MVNNNNNQTMRLYISRHELIYAPVRLPANTSLRTRRINASESLIPSPAGDAGCTHTHTYAREDTDDAQVRAPELSCAHAHRPCENAKRRHEIQAKRG